MFKLHHYIYIILIAMLLSSCKGDGRKENDAGFDAANQRNYDLAIRYFNEAIEINPQLYEAYYNRAKVYSLMGKNSFAIRDFTKTIELKPTYYQAFASRGILYAETGQNEMAKKDFALAMAINPKQASEMISAQIKSIQEQTQAKAQEQTQTKADSQTEPLLKAARNGDTKVVKSLIEAGKDLNAQDKEGRTALIIAVANKQAEVVKLLIDAGVELLDEDANMTTQMKTALRLARLNKDTESLLLLMDYYDVNFQKEALVVAARKGWMKELKALISSGANVNAKNKNNKTALIMAVQTGHTEIVKILIDAGADVNVQTDNGETALTIAELKGYSEIVRILHDKSSTAHSDKSLKEYIREGTELANFVGRNEAKQKFLEAIQQYPEEAQAHYVFGNFLYNFYGGTTDGLNLAESELRIAIKLDPNFTPSYYDLGRVLKAKGLETEAEEAFLQYRNRESQISEKKK